MASVVSDPPTRQLLRHDLTALGLMPDSSSVKLHINFCCLIKECFPTHNNFLFYLRHKNQLENKTPSNIKKWKPFFSSLGLVS